MKNEKTWAFANDFSSKCLLVLTVTSIIFYVIANYFLEGEKVVIIAAAFYVLNLLSVIPITEFFLKMIFEDNGDLKLQD